MPADDQWDDPGVAHGEVLYRYVHKTQWVASGDSIERRLSSSFMLLEPNDDGLSAYSASLLEKHSFHPKDILPESSYGYVEFTAGDARELGYGVVFDADGKRPVNVAHMLVKLPPDKLLQMSRKDRRNASVAFSAKLTMVKSPDV